VTGRVVWKPSWKTSSASTCGRASKIRRRSPSSSHSAAGVSGEDPTIVAPRLALEAVYPNPLSGAATVAFELPAPGSATLTVYDVLGRRVAVLSEGEHAAGRHVATLDGAALASGVYVVRLVAGEQALSRRITVAR
jgi:hypothetical protein